MSAGLALSAQASVADAGLRGGADKPTAVAFLAIRNERLRTLLDAYLNGPGRQHFELREPGSAQVLLADADHAEARAVLQHSLHQHRRPAVAIAARDPMIDGAVWLQHPFSFEALRWAVAAAREAEPDAADCPPAAAPRSASARMTPRFVARAVDADLPSAASRTPFGRQAEGDWTGTAVWLALGLLTIAWLASLLGWRPAAEAPAPRVVQRAVPGLVSNDDVLRQAVADSLRDYRGHSPQELEDIRQQRESLQAEQRLADAPSDRREPWAQLMRPGATPDWLRGDPQRVPVAQMAQARPVNAGSEAFRRSLDDAVARALAQQPAGSRGR